MKLRWHQRDVPGKSHRSTGGKKDGSGDRVGDGVGDQAWEPWPRGACGGGGRGGRWAWSWAAVAEGVVQDTGRWTQQLQHRAPPPPPAPRLHRHRQAGHQGAPQLTSATHSGPPSWSMSSSRVLTGSSRPSTCTLASRSCFSRSTRSRTPGPCRSRGGGHMGPVGSDGQGGLSRPPAHGPVPSPGP